jgi:CheY-like chemotaxis protein
MPDSSATKTVLIVEDNCDQADTLAMLLELKGHKTLIANDAETGLDLARAAIPDIIIHDINLPNMSGYVAAQKLREEAALSESILVALTGYAGEEDKKRAMSAGFDFHMAKPLDFRLLSSLVGL